MKIRMGFVSNSSTSSYLIISTLAGHQETLAKLSAVEAKLMENYRMLEKKKVLGVDAVVFSYASGNYGYDLNDLFDPKLFDELMPEEDPGDAAYYLINKYMDEVQKHQDTYYHSEDF
jgi:hypothetical protein